MEMHYWYQSPEVRRPDDLLLVYGWLRDTLPAVVDRFEVTVHEPTVEQ
jgi:hypothetical protein